MSENSDFLTLDIVTLDNPLFKGRVRAVSAPTALGQITVLPNHLPLITQLKAGEVKLKVNEGEGIYAPDIIYVAISGGFMEVKPGSVVNIIADSALRIDSIDEQKAMEAKNKAEQLLRDYQQHKVTLSDQEFAGAAAMLERALAQLKVARRKHKK